MSAQQPVGRGVMRGICRTGTLVVLLLTLFPGRLNPLSEATLDPDASHSGASGTAERDLSIRLQQAERRAETIEAWGRSLSTLHDEEVVPLVEALLDKTQATRDEATRLAVMLIREGHSVGIDPRLLLSVLLVENAWLDPTAESMVGAVGLMQVMPFHAGTWGCPGDDLTDPAHNICHGARILAHALEESGGDLDAALLRYNGCVHGTNVPDCHSYPSWVYDRAGAEWARDIIDAGGRS